ncbi:unnamed protein product [Caenorhabditis angaria]|uniref:Uncharacterized protein n=1 Tax=Caenorhabditis angaria TaxID=860376 RepID=A0A9P1ICU2_9PELO|nr:unnamed protein product [Caenorhabditis angaria]
MHGTSICGRQKDIWRQSEAQITITTLSSTKWQIYRNRTNTVSMEEKESIGPTSSKDIRPRRTRKDRAIPSHLPGSNEKKYPTSTTMKDDFNATTTYIFKPQ